VDSGTPYGSTGTENAGPENGGPKKIKDGKCGTRKWRTDFAWLENAGLEYEGSVVLGCKNGNMGPVSKAGNGEMWEL